MSMIAGLASASRCSPKCFRSDFKSPSESYRSSISPPTEVTRLISDRLKISGPSSR